MITNSESIEKSVMETYKIKIWCQITKWVNNGHYRRGPIRLDINMEGNFIKEYHTDEVLLQR